MTDRNLQVLQAVADLIDDFGWPPTILELGMKLEIRSKATVARHLDHLQTAGLIYRLPDSPRALRITPRGHDALRRSRDA